MGCFVSMSGKGNAAGEVAICSGYYTGLFWSCSGLVLVSFWSCSEATEADQNKSRTWYEQDPNETRTKPLPKCPDFGVTNTMATGFFCQYDSKQLVCMLKCMLKNVVPDPAT